MKDLQNILIDFIENASELIDHIMADIIELEENHDQEIIHPIYRGFHLNPLFVTRANPIIHCEY